MDRTIITFNVELLQKGTNIRTASLYWYLWENRDKKIEFSYEDIADFFVCSVSTARRMEQRLKKRNLITVSKWENGKW